MCEMPQVYHHFEPTARVRHVCYECRGEIEIGETYHRHQGLWDGHWDTYKVCVDCDGLREEMNKGRELYDRIPFGGLSEDVFEEREPLRIGFFMGIVMKRRGKVPPWMLDRVNELLDPGEKAS